MLSQSGALCTAILDLAAGRHLRLAKPISIGNTADLDETDFLEALAEDDDPRLIVGYIENIAAGDVFIERAEVASTVRNGWQRRGIGTCMLRNLITIARRSGISGFTAVVLRENRPMRSVVRNSGCKITTRLEGGIYHDTLDVI